MDWLAIPARRIGSASGVPISVDMTFAFAALSVALGVTRLPYVSFAEMAAIFVLVTLGLFASILAHEFGHAIIGRRVGLDPIEIRIGGFYGLAILSGAPVSDAKNALVLMAGPLANALLFLALWAMLGMPAISDRLYFDATQYASWTADMPALRIAVRWLAMANLAMCLFNLLPAFPLDGGRIARLGLARVIRDATAVRTIAAAGILIGIWACFGALAFPTLLFVAPFLVLANWAIWKGDIEAP
ncbi:MAG: site-2 protease family protein [Hyphomicrobium sp.]